MSQLKPTQQYNFKFLLNTFKDTGIHFAPGVMIYKGKYIMYLVNAQSKNWFKHEQAQLIKDLGGYFNINLDNWVIEI